MQNMARWEFIYNQINGFNEPDVCQWVRDESAIEGALGPLIERIYQLRARLGERLGVDPWADQDLERLVDSCEALSRACGEQMYRYGYQDGRNAE